MRVPGPDCASRSLATSMIEPPQPDESEKLVVLAQATGFFNPEEIRIVREMLADFFASRVEAGQETPESVDYIWAVYREAPDTPALGFVCYGPVSLSDDVYDVYWIAVDSRRQSRGIGTTLLEYVEGDLKGRNARQCYIETSDTLQYAPTRAFYERRGYKQAAHFPDYYHVGDGKVVYCKLFGEREGNSDPNPESGSQGVVGAGSRG
jgi:GNAT superfamily N-acetyltransferase